MNRNQFLDELQKGLNLKGINTVSQLFSFLKQNNVSTNEKTEYIDFLRNELSYQTEKRTQILDSNSIGQYLSDKYSRLDHEEFHIISINNSGHIIADDLITSGTLTKSVVDTRGVFQDVIKRNASGFFMFHNHPSGNLTPSSNDLHLTDMLVKASQIMQIECLDHIIVGNGHYVSLREQDMM